MAMTEAARANAALPPHPGLGHHLGGPEPDEPLAPICLCGSPLRILSEQQRDELDDRGWTVLEAAFAPRVIDALRAEIDVLEAELNPPDGPGRALGPPENVAAVDSGQLRTPSGAIIGNISDARAITFSSALADRSATVRAFCGSDVFQRLAHDTLGAGSVRLYNDEAAYKKPCPGRSFPFHQDSGYMFTRPLRYLTCWTALHAVTRESGSPWFIPQLHKRGPVDHDFDEANHGWTIPGLRVDDAVCVPLAAGSTAVFWSHTPHSTGPNGEHSCLRTTAFAGLRRHTDSPRFCCLCFRDRRRAERVHRPANPGRRAPGLGQVSGKACGPAAGGGW